MRDDAVLRRARPLGRGLGRQDLDTDLVWLSIVRLESSVAPRILTLSESGMTVPATFVGVEPGMDLTHAFFEYYTLHQA